jgi:2-keto-4-pentenoate hydratase
MQHKLTEILLRSRISGSLIVDLPTDAVPQTVEDAYRVQNETVAVLGPVGAWKVQPMPETGVPFASPILARTVLADGALLRAADFPSLGIEVEVAVTLGRDLPLKPEGYTAADLPSAIGSFHIALELLASRFIDRSAVPKLTGIADLQHSGAIVLGAPVSFETLPEFGNQTMSLNMDDVSVAETSGNATTANMMAALAWLANHAAARGLQLKAGDIVITGARLGPVPLDGSKVHALAAGLGSVSAVFH